MGARVTKLTRKESKRKKLKTTQDDTDAMPSTSIAYEEFTRQKSFRWSKLFRRKSQSKREKPSQILLEFEKLNRITYESGEVKGEKSEAVAVHVEAPKSKSFDYLSVEEEVAFEPRKSLGDVNEIRNEDEDRLKKSGGMTCLASAQSDFVLEELPSEASSDKEPEIMEVGQEISSENDVSKDGVNLVEDHYNGKTTADKIDQEELVLVPLSQKKISNESKLREIEERFNDVRNAVEAFVGKTSDKLYTYLDEMLTALLVALDSMDVTDDHGVNETRKQLYKKIYACNEMLEERAFEEVNKQSTEKGASFIKTDYTPKTPNNTPIDSQLDDFELMHAIEDIHPYKRLVEEDEESCDDKAVDDDSVVSSRSQNDFAMGDNKNTTPQNSPSDFSPITNSANVEELIAATAEKIDELSDARKELKREK